MINLAQIEANINENTISDTRFEKLLGVTCDNRLNFNHHISKICKTARNKIHALARLSHYMDEDKSRILFNFSFHFSLITVYSYGLITTNQQTKKSITYKKET